MSPYPEPMARLISQLQKLPTIGPKSAQRLAFYFLKMTEGDAKGIAESIKDVKASLDHCKLCGNITDIDPCRICIDPKRNQNLICVVEEPDDLLAIERTNQYKGLYHTLMGVLSPLNGIGPQDLRISGLFDRLKKGQINEVILAVGSTTEGQATSLYLTQQLTQHFSVSVSQIAQGIPVGGDLDYIDELTIARALEGRRIFMP